MNIADKIRERISLEQENNLVTLKQNILDTLNHYFTTFDDCFYIDIVKHATMKDVEHNRMVNEISSPTTIAEISADNRDNMIRFLKENGFKVSLNNNNKFISIEL